jgi:hypothetical protein
MAEAMSALAQAYADYEAARDRLLKALRQHGQGDDMPLMAYDIGALLPPSAPREVATRAYVVLRHYPEVQPAQLLQLGRKRSEVEARHVLMHMLRQFTSLSSAQIGQALNRHYNSVLWAAGRIKSLETVEYSFAARMRRIRAECAQALAEPPKPRPLGICDGCDAEGVELTEVSGAPVVGACLCRNCLKSPSA